MAPKRSVTGYSPVDLVIKMMAEQKKETEARIKNLASAIRHLTNEVKYNRDRIDKLVIKSDPF